METRKGSVGVASRWMQNRALFQAYRLNGEADYLDHYRHGSGSEATRIRFGEIGRGFASCLLFANLTSPIVIFSKGGFDLAFGVVRRLIFAGFLE